MTDFSCRVSVAPVVVATFALGVRTPVTIASTLIVVTSITGTTPEVRQLIIKVVDFSTCEPTPSPSLIKRNHGYNPSTPIEEGSHNWDHLIEDVGSRALSPLFRIPFIIPSLVPSTPKEFAIVVANKDLDFVLSLSATDMQGIFADASGTLFRVESLVLMVTVGQDDVLGSSDLFRENDELKEKCEALERKNSAVEKDLVGLWMKVELDDSL